MHAKSKTRGKVTQSHHTISVKQQHVKERRRQRKMEREKLRMSGGEVEEIKQPGEKQTQP
jgi:hypothetical protein